MKRPEGIDFQIKVLRVSVLNVSLETSLRIPDLVQCTTNNSESKFTTAFCT